MRRILWFAPLALVVLLSACTTTVDTNVGKDGSGSVATSIGMTPAELQSLSSLSASGENFCDSIQASNGLPPQVTIHQEQRGDETWCVATQPFKDLDGLRSVYGELGNVQINELTLNDGRLVYDVVVDMTDMTTEGIDPSLLNTVQLDFEWSLTVPGSVGQNNADQVNGQTLTWKLTPGKTAQLHAESNYSTLPSVVPQIAGGSVHLPNWLVPVVIGLLCLDVIIVIVAAVVIFDIVRRRRKKR